MSAALELIETVKAAGCWMRVESGYLVIRPDSAALPFLTDLRQHKQEIIRLLESCLAVSAPDPEEWLGAVREPFVRWLDSTCALHPRAFGGVAALQINFCQWLAAQGEAPCNRETFVQMLEGFGLLVGEVAGVVLVSGMTFRGDLEVYP